MGKTLAWLSDSRISTLGSQAPTTEEYLVSHTELQGNKPKWIQHILQREETHQSFLI